MIPTRASANVSSQADGRSAMADSTTRFVRSTSGDSVCTASLRDAAFSLASGGAIHMLPLNRLQGQGYGS
jgi:hypothetical protein